MENLLSGESCVKCLVLTNILANVAVAIFKVGMRWGKFWRPQNYISGPFSEPMANGLQIQFYQRQAATDSKVGYLQDPVFLWQGVHQKNQPSHLLHQDYGTYKRH
jgi:hypothetical protein